MHQDEAIFGVGLYHFAWEMPSFEALEQLHDRLVAKNADICGYSPAKDSTNDLEAA